MRYHWQNLNHRPHGSNGWGLFHGRAWWYPTARTTVSFLWRIKPRLELEAFVETGGPVSGDRDVMFHLSLFGISAYLGISCPWFTAISRRASKRDGWRSGVALVWERTLQLSVDIASRSFSWRSKDPFWIRGVRFDFADLLFGRTMHSREVLRTERVLIPMPEGSYAATVELDVRRWKRPRWPWALVRRGSVVDIPSGIPHAGKGENPWDCGDDGLYGMSGSSVTIEDAIGAVVACVLDKRARYGTASWLRDKQPVVAELPGRAQA